MRNTRRNNNRKHRKINGCITVNQEECHGDAERMVRRFIKKVKNDGILDEARSRTTFTKPSELRRQKKAAIRKTIEKVNKQRQDLFNPGERKLPRSRRSKR